MTDSTSSSPIPAPVSDNSALDPQALYLNIQHKLQTPDDYEFTDIAHDFGHLMNAMKVLLNENAHLKAIVKSADELLKEQEIEIFVKDCEIFNFTSQNQQKEQNDGK